MIKVEIQYFNGCPNSQKMIDNVKLAIESLNYAVDYSETLVETNEIADKVKFRGSPTLLINGKDFEGLPEMKKSNLACRFYPDGIPEVREIINSINNEKK